MSGVSDLARRATDVARRTARRAYTGARSVDVLVSAPLAVLGYHRVADTTCDPWGLAVSPRHFDEQVSVLARSGTVQPLGRALQLHRRGRHGRRRPTTAVTFDDGYADNLHAAVPILERHGVPATIFIATRFLDTPSFWWDRLSAIILGSGVPVEEISDACRTLGLYDVDSDGGDPPPDRERLHDVVYEHLAWYHPDEIDATLDALAARISHALPAADGRPLTTDELIELDQHPLITVGVHTVNHRRLGALDRTTVIDELVVGRQQLEAIVGARPPLMAYPYGDASRATAAAAKEAGFRHGVTTRRGLVSAFDDRLLLPRLQPGDIGGDEFEEFLRGHSTQLAGSSPPS
jgi:peptidoglycan/xylan/chitin deacetylase (PgdA/CDA1 family)